jgi:hypothetical protein
VRRHPALKSRRVRAVDWKRHENNIYDKIIHWFNVIGKVLQDPAIQLRIGRRSDSSMLDCRSWLSGCSYIDNRLVAA